MSDNKVKSISNISRAADEIKKKLEISFTPQQNEIPTSSNTEVNKAVLKEEPKLIGKDLSIYGNADKKASSINTDINKSVQGASAKDFSGNPTKSGNRYQNVTPRVFLW